MEGTSYESDMLDDPNDWYRSSDPIEFDLDNYNQMYLEDSTYSRGYKDNNPNNPLQCKICNFVFKRKSNLTKHTLARHSIEKPFKCDKCPYTASLIGYLKRHRRVHERTVEDDYYKCDLCSYRTHLMSNLRSHSITHLGYKPFKCELCGFLTTHENYLTKHMVRRHPEPPFEPEIPPLPPRKTFLDEENGEIDVVGGDADREVYDEELNRDAESDEEVVPAPPTEEDLEELRKSTVFLTTGTERKYKCDQCGFSTHNKLRFKEHSSVHTGQYPYKCIHCNYRTARKYDFDQHKRSHSRQTGFKCQRCNIYFKWKCDLQSHMSKHVKPRVKRQYIYQPPQPFLKPKKAEPKIPTIFQCDECDANYATNKSYRRHKQRHMLEKPLRLNTKPETSARPKEPTLAKPKEPSMKSSYHFCLMCNVTFHSRKELNLHKSIHYRVCRLKLHRLPDAKDYFTIGSIHTPVEPNYPNPVIRISSRAGPYSKKIARIYKTTATSSLSSILNLASVPPVISYPTDILQLEPFWTNKEPICENIPNKAAESIVSNSITNIDLSGSKSVLDDAPKLISVLDDVSEPISDIFDDGISDFEPINMLSEEMVSIKSREKSHDPIIKTETLFNALQDIDVNVACNSSTQTEAITVPIKSEIIKTEHLSTGDDLDFWIEGDVSKPDSEVLDVICVSDSDSEDEKQHPKLPEDDSAMLRQYILQSAAKDIATRIINNGKRAALVAQETVESPSLTSARIYRCEKCDYQTGQKFAFKKHLKLHWEKRKYACDLCGLRFKRRLRLSQHKFDHK